MKNILLIFSFLFFTNCSNKKTPDQSGSQKSLYAFDNIVPYQDTLIIKSSFSDCGEWGGHDEFIKIYRSEKKIKLTYIKYEEDCNNKDQSGSIVQVEKMKKNISLSRFQKIALMNYMESLMKSQFLNKVISHSGNFFYLENTDGSLKISCGGNHPTLLENYNLLMTKLEFPRIVIGNK